MKFLEAACGLADNFLYRMENSLDCFRSPNQPARGRYVPLWDFDVAVEDKTNPIRDSSAAAIAANGMVIVSEALFGVGRHELAKRFRAAAFDIARYLGDFALAKEKALFEVSDNVGFAVQNAEPRQVFEGILRGNEWRASIVSIIPSEAS